ncbi:MAG TPA: acetyl-CoA carboxylase biotin carboxyl carrier protein subunit [Ktedonobacterales bacterium]
MRIALRRRLDAPLVVPTAQIVTATRAPRLQRAEPAPSSTPAPNPADAGVAIIAPLTGVFYTASSPSAEPFAKVGEMVQAGQIVCIVEAMKVFNEIKSEMSGVVASIPAQNGQLVQKGDALVRIKPL